MVHLVIPVYLLELRLVSVEVLDLALELRCLVPLVVECAYTCEALILVLELAHLVETIDHFWRLLNLLI